jgi:hypothetical protein
MKYLFSILVLFLTSCKPIQQSNYIVCNQTLSTTVNCPENGTCSLELIPNKSLEFKMDEFGNSYPVITKGEMVILKYTFKKKPISNAQDSNYTEIIYAELNKNISELTLKDEELETKKLYFGRLCYCKGETGYYPIKKGEFKLTKEAKNTIKIDFKFTIKEVPQIITTINEFISLKSN